MGTSTRFTERRRIEPGDAEIAIADKIPVLGETEEKL